MDSRQRKKENSEAKNDRKANKNKKRKDRLEDEEHNEKGRADKRQGGLSEKEQHQQMMTKPPAADISVHRLRCLEYQPFPVLCMRATPRSWWLPSSSTNPVSANENEDDLTSAPFSSYEDMVAISRSSGMIELKRANQRFRTVATAAGARERPAEQLAWIKTPGTKERPPTLVGASQDGSLFVVNWQSGRLEAVTETGGGACFCLVPLSMPQQQQQQEQNGCDLVAAGCEDGSVRIFRVGFRGQSEEKEIALQSTIPCTGGAVLSLAWRRFGNTGGGSVCGSVVYAGCADGTIRRYDCYESSSSSTNTAKPSFETPVWKPTMRMTVENFGRNLPTRIWALQALQDGTVISADSNGHVQFWEGATGTLQQTILQNESTADALDLAVSEDECKVFAVGVDSRVVCIERETQQIRTAHDSNHYQRLRKWVLTNSQRPHTHDVKTITICRQKHEKLSALPAEIVMTGGVDCKLCTYSVSGFAKKRPKILYPWPVKSPVAAASAARQLLMLREDRVDLYQLAPPTIETKMNAQALTAVPEKQSLIGTVEIRSAWNLAEAAISPDGRFLAISDAAALYLFQLKFVVDENGSKSLTPTQLPAREISLELGVVVAMKFLRHDCLVLCCDDGRIHIVSFQSEGSDKVEDNSTEEDCVFQAVLQQSIAVKMSAEKNEDAIVTESICVSTDGIWLAVCRTGISSCQNIEVFRRDQDQVGLLRHWWTMPKLDVPSSAMTFLPNAVTGAANHFLAVACLNYACYVFDLSQRRLSPWSEAAGFPLTTSLPSELARRNDYPVRMIVDPKNPSKLFMVCKSLFFVAGIILRKALFQHSCNSKWCVCLSALLEQLFSWARFRPLERLIRFQWYSNEQHSLTSIFSLLCTQGSFGALVLINTDETFPTKCRTFPERHVRRRQHKKRKQSEDQNSKSNSSCCTVCLRYNCMVFADFVDKGEMVVAEQPWLDVVATFPDALQRRIYAT